MFGLGNLLGVPINNIDFKQLLITYSPYVTDYLEKNPKILAGAISYMMEKDSKFRDFVAYTISQKV